MISPYTYIYCFLLDIGPAPFRVIKPYFNEWLVEQAG